MRKSYVDTSGGQIHVRSMAGEGAPIVFYRLVPDNLVNTLNGYVQEVCPASRPLKAESAEIARKGIVDKE